MKEKIETNNLLIFLGETQNLEDFRIRFIAAERV
jgi:hypothetical protein